MDADELLKELDLRQKEQKLQEQLEGDCYDPILMKEFLDGLMEQVENDPSKLVSYTKEMDDELEALLNSVEVSGD